MGLVDKVTEAFVSLKRNTWDPLDESLQRFYTRIGRRIPERRLYPITVLANLASMGGVTLSGLYFADYPALAIVASASPVILNAPDLFLSFSGSCGSLNREASSEVVADDPSVDMTESYVKFVRLPTFLAGVGFGVKALYDVGRTIFGGEPIDLSDTAAAVYHSLSFLALSSSMYLKDQNPKLLERAAEEVKLVPAYAVVRGR